MRSKISFFNVTLFKKNLSRFWPLWGLASFAGALAPLTMLLQMIRESDLKMTELIVGQAYYTALTVFVPIISLLYAVLCAVAVWSYLYNPRSVGMIHRLPIRREGLFITNFLSGLTMMLIPYVVTGFLTVLLTAVQGQLALKYMLVTILGVLGESFFYFSSATFAAFLTGNVFAMPVLYFLLHFLQPLVSFLMRMLQSGFYYGVGAVSPTRSGEWLCPTVCLVTHTQVQYLYEDETRWDGYQQYVSNRLVGVELHEPWLIGVYAAVGAVLLALAYLLYRKRNSEGAGDVAAVRWMRPIFRYGAALLLGVSGGMLLYNLMWKPFQGRSLYEYELLPLIICMIIMGLIGYFGVSMLLEKSLRVFRKREFVGAALAAAALALLCVAIRMDVFCIEARVPQAAEVVRVEIWSEGNNYTLERGEEDALIEKTVELHRAVVEDLDLIRRMDRNLMDTSGMVTGFTQLELTYELTNGQRLRRTYSLYPEQNRTEQEGTYEHELRAFLNDPEAKRLRLKIQDNVEIIGGTLHGSNYEVHRELTASQAAAIRAAVAKDAENGTWGDVDWFADEEENYFFAVAELYLTEDLGEDRERRRDISLLIRPSMTETIAALQGMDMISPEFKVLEQAQELPGAASLDGLAGTEVTMEAVG